MTYDYIDNQSPGFNASSSQPHKTDLNARVIFIHLIGKQDYYTSPEKALLRALQQYIISTRWKTGLQGDIILYNKGRLRKAKIPHDISGQLKSIETYTEAPCKEKARDTIITVFNDIPECFLRKNHSIYSWLKRFLNPDLTTKYYAKFQLDTHSRNQLIQTLELDMHVQAIKLLDSLLPVK